MHLAVYNKEMIEWCWWCKLRKEVIMCIRALYSPLTGCVLFHLQTSKHSRRYILPCPWAECLARLSLQSIQYSCTDCAAHRLPGVTCHLSKDSLFETMGPVLDYLTCGKKGFWEKELPLLIVPCIPILRAEVTEKRQTQHLLEALIHRAPVNTSVLHRGGGLRGAEQQLPHQ